MRARVHEEIRQTRPFANRTTEALVGILRTAAVLEHAFGEGLKPFGVTLTQYNVLRILRGAGEAGLCGRDVGERLISKVPDVPRLLERMEETGLIRRERDAQDRRLVTARITAEGLRILEEVSPVLERIEAERFSAVGDDELALVIHTLDSIRHPS